MGIFYSCLRLFSRIFRRSDDFLANFCKNSWVVGVHIVLLASLLMLVLMLASLYYFWHPCWCGSPLCCWRCDVPIVSAAVGLPPCCCRIYWFCKNSCFWWRPYCIGVPFVAFIPAVACVPAVVSGHDIDVILNVACCWRCLCRLHPDCGRYSCRCWRSNMLLLAFVLLTASLLPAILLTLVSLFLLVALHTGL